MRNSAIHRYLRVAPRKVRLVADLVKGKEVSEADQILRVVPKAAAEPLRKLLKSAVASTRHNFQRDATNLYIANVQVQEGPKLKRYRPRARGRAYPIQKKTSHITLVLDEITPRAEQETPARHAAQGAAGGDLPQSGKVGLGQRPKLRAIKDMAKPKAEGVGKRIFRRKSI